MKKYIIYVAIVALVVFGVYKKVYIPKHTYETTVAVKADMDVRVNGVGNVGAKDIYKIGSIYGGKVLDLIVSEGDFIKKGTIIATIDSIDLKDKIDEAIAILAKSKSDSEGLSIDEQSAITAYEYENHIFIKNKKLYKQGSLAELNYKKYKTLRDIAKLKIATIKSKIVSFDKQIEQIQANINGLKKRLSKYTIISPVDGYIVKKSISNYQIISPNQTIIEIVNPKDIWVETYIDTRMSGDVKIGDKAMIKLRSSDKKVAGKVVNIKPINNSVTNEREVDVAFDDLKIPFYLEEQASVSISTKKLKNIIKIPTKTLIIYKEKTGVWILDTESKAKFVPLDILAYQRKDAGIKEFDISKKILIPNPKKKLLFNGMKIIND